MTKQEFHDAAKAIAVEAGVVNGPHSYFVQESEVIYMACDLFGLFHQPLGRVLEIGAFYSYTPFLLRSRAESYTVLEGDDPAMHPLKAPYEKRGIDLELLDLSDLFGGAPGAPQRLPFDDAQFDTILCWMTMEHFNFNPVKFVRELHRLARPGGRVCVTVPNKASFERVFALVTGYRDDSMMDAFFTFEDYECNGRKAFFGFHWREYSCRELSRLFRRGGFEVRQAGTFDAYETHDHTPAIKRASRIVMRVLARLLPRFGRNVYLVGQKS